MLLHFTIALIGPKVKLAHRLALSSYSYLKTFDLSLVAKQFQKVPLAH